MLKNVLNFLNSPKQPGVQALLFTSLIVLFSIFLGTGVWLFVSLGSGQSRTSATSRQKPTLFALSYPANSQFQKELVEMKSSNQLHPSDELEIQKSLLSSAEFLEVPPSLLWCLLFQESRLNHLEGLNSDKSVLGLGQFSRFSFYEINYQQNNYDSRNSNLFSLMFGRDIRPIAAKQKDLVNASSYFHIPTAVVASSIYLHNRYFHLTKILDQKKLPYNPDIVWLFAAMAYNKGTRSVLNLWNVTYHGKSPENLHRLLNEYEYFRKTTSDSAFLTQTLARIWAEPRARAYAKELSLHTKNISACSVAPVFQPTRSLMESEG